jgi:hypothetical protein
MKVSSTGLADPGTPGFYKKKPVHACGMQVRTGILGLILFMGFEVFYWGYATNRRPG